MHEICEAVNLNIRNQVLWFWSQRFKFEYGADLPSSVPSKAACQEIGPALWKIGLRDFVRMGNAFSW